MADSTPTPELVSRVVNRSASERKYDKDIERARSEGFREGRSRAHTEMLEWLNKEYMSPSVDRSSDRAKSILGLTLEMGKYFRGLSHPSR